MPTMADSMAEQAISHTTPLYTDFPNPYSPVSPDKQQRQYIPPIDFLNPSDNKDPEDMDPSDISSDAFYSNLRRLAVASARDTAMAASARDTAVRTSTGTWEDVITTVTKTWPSLDDLYEEQYRSNALRYATRAAFTEQASAHVSKKLPLGPATYDILAMIGATESEILQLQQAIMPQVQQHQLYSNLWLPHRILLQIIHTPLMTWAKRFILSGLTLFFLIIFIDAAGKRTLRNLRNSLLVIAQIIIELTKLLVKFLLRNLLSLITTLTTSIANLRIRERITVFREWVSDTYTNLMYNAITDVVFEDAQLFRNFLGRNKHWFLLGILAYYWCSAVYANHVRLQEGKYVSLEEAAKQEGFRIPMAFILAKAREARLYDDCGCQC